MLIDTEDFFIGKIWIYLATLLEIFVPISLFSWVIIEENQSGCFLLKHAVDQNSDSALQCDDDDDDDDNGLLTNCET